MRIFQHLLYSFLLIITYSCINNKVSKTQPVWMDVLPSTCVPVMIFNYTDDHCIYRDLSYMCDSNKVGTQMYFFAPTKEEIMIAERVTLDYYDLFLSKYNNTSYKKSFLGKCARQYIGFSCGNKRYIRTNYLLKGINERSIRKNYDDWFKNYYFSILSYKQDDMITFVINISDTLYVSHY